jgi:hypothetical protein
MGGDGCDTRYPLCVDNGLVPVEALALQICAFCGCGLG